MAGPYPLPTLACTVGPTGISAPSYADIYASLQATFQSIYGSDSYINPDSQDGQMLAIFAQAQDDSNQATIAAYNNFSPATAVGNGLSSVVKINGLQRDISTFSTAVLTIVGQAGRIIGAGLVGDNQNLGTQWALPGDILIPPGGSIDVTATCTTPGAVAAAPNTLTVILNPTLGWQSTNNASNASLGQPVEDDAELRQRQSVSTSLPATTPLEAIYAALANTTGVTRVLIHENDTGSTDGDDVPAKSICCVVEGGDAMTIAQVIEQKKTLGCGTYGSTSEDVLDPGGQTITISFDVLGYDQIYVEVDLTPGTGYTTTIGNIIVAAIVQYINTLPIGGNVSLTKLYGPANLSGTAAVAAATAIIGMQQTQAQLDTMSATYELTGIKIGSAGTGMSAQSATLESSGSGGYTATDVLHPTGGTHSVQTAITVDTVDGSGNILTFHISTAGAYTVPIFGTAATTGGTGTGATFTMEYLTTSDQTVAFNFVAQTATAQIDLVS